MVPIVVPLTVEAEEVQEEMAVVDNKKSIIV